MAMTAMKKKVWSKPKLVALVRGKPEEAVLNGCKLGYPGGGSGENAVFAGCYLTGCASACLSLLDT